MGNTGYNTIMVKKILGAVAVSIFIGLPSFAMAGCSIAGGDTPSMCESIGGVWTNGGGMTGGGSGSSGTAGGGSAMQVTAQLKNPIKFNTFSDFVAQVTKSAVEILLPFVVLAFIYSGFLFVRAQGNTEDLKKAKSAIGWSVVGAFILMGAWGFAQIISTTVARIAG